MKTKTYKVYRFEELPEAAKIEAIKRYRDINVEDNNFWTNPDSVYELKKKLVKLGYENVKVLFSGFGSQGDGACFEATIDFPKYLKAHKIARKYSSIIHAAQAGELSAKLVHSGRCVHARMTSLEWDNSISYDKIDKAIAALEEIILAERITFGNAIYKALEQEYDSQTSDEAVIDTFQANDYWFTNDGKID